MPDTPRWTDDQDALLAGAWYRGYVAAVNGWPEVAPYGEPGLRLIQGEKDMPPPRTDREVLEQILFELLDYAADGELEPKVKHVLGLVVDQLGDTRQ